MGSSKPFQVMERTTSGMIQGSITRAVKTVAKRVIRCSNKAAIMPKMNLRTTATMV